MQEVEGEPLFCERAAGIDTGKASVFVTIRVPSEAREGGRQQETREFGTAPATAGTGGLAALLGRGESGHGVHQRLLEAGASPAAGAGGLQVPALPGVTGQGTARAAQDRQAGLGIASRITERGSLAASFRARPGGDPPGSHPYPLPAAPGRSRPAPRRRSAPRSCWRTRT